MKNKLIPILFLLMVNFASAQELEKKHQKVVLKFVNYVKTKNTEALSTLVSYPLKRVYPLSSINDQVQFINRYDEIFDETLIKETIKSNVKKDWDAVGWRGIMLNRGTLWLDYDGKLIAVNYQSDMERIKREKLIKADKAVIHQSLINFKQPTLTLVTKNFKIRIDELDNGTYRYASWPLNSPMSTKPDLVLKNGILVFYGSGGNHHYEFKNGQYKYVCPVNIMGNNETPPANLLVYKKNKVILNQAAEID